MPRELVVSAPGRICLFGEHQDYLELPVITSAINLRIEIKGKPIPEKTVRFSLPDIQSEERFNIQANIPYNQERDYFKSVVNVLQREGLSLEQGFNCVVRGNIPINSGTSSSSALVVAWVKFLLEAVNHHRKNDAVYIAQLAHKAEVVEFNEPGGMMDHFATSLGGVLFLDFRSPQPVQRLTASLGKFVLGDSKESKDTKGILARVKNGMLSILKTYPNHIPYEKLPELSIEDVAGLRSKLSAEQFDLLRGFLENKEITFKALHALKRPLLDHSEFGRLLNRHQAVLRDVLKISTPKIDRMLEAALKAGALGGKINGSGGGGCMFAYAPDNPEAVAEAIREAGGIPYIVDVDEGVRSERIQN
ncbi:MAG: GHMP kinase [Calditrichaeota bacterium]|nr:GHMP kinase [Calditrichota bacterium]